MGVNNAIRIVPSSTKMIQGQAAALQTALAASRAEDRLQDGSDHIQCLEHCCTSLPQPPHADTWLCMEYGRLALHCFWHSLASGTPLLERPSGKTDFTAVVSVIRHLLSGTQFLGQCLIVSQWHFKNLGTIPTFFTWLIITESDWRDMTWSATASEVMTLWRYRNIYVVIATTTTTSTTMTIRRDGKILKIFCPVSQK